MKMYIGEGQNVRVLFALQRGDIRPTKYILQTLYNRYVIITSYIDFSAVSSSNGNILFILVLIIL